MGFIFCVAYLGVINELVWSLYPALQMFTSSDAHRVRKAPPMHSHYLASFLSNVNSLLISLLQRSLPVYFGHLIQRYDFISKLEVLLTIMVSIMKSCALGNVIIAGL